ncbi:hypothetical protein BGZ67_009653 [Mortierella alpina]|nr:hypothetical protein BGZ67_009653 [Mortierella alpina]
MPFSKTRTKSSSSISRPSVSSSSQSQDSSSISSASGSNVDSILYPNFKPLPKAHAPMASVDPNLAMPFDMSILTITHKRNHNSVKAVIVGAGIAGLAIAIMMDMAGMEYDILERTTGVEPNLGVAVALGPPVLRLLEQMGLLEQVEKSSRIVTGLSIMNPESRRLGRVEGVEPSRYGYPMRFMTRGALHRILLEKVSKAHVHLGKYVVETLQNPNGVSCKCSDGSTYYGDIIIGADGAQSKTRERMYMQLKEHGKLPEADMEPSLYDHLAIGGVTDPLDKRHFPSAHDPERDFQVIYTKESPYTFWYLPVEDNRMAWGISNNQEPKLKHHAYSNTVSYSSTDLNTAAFLQATTGFSGSDKPLPPPPRSKTATPPLKRRHSQVKIHDDWFAPIQMDVETRFKDLLSSRCSVGTGDVRDFVRQTPRRNMVMVDVEERLYKTWYHGRIVLVGDACHQHLVIGGQSAIQGLLDGVCIVNLLYDMEHNSPNEIARVFKTYHAKRSGQAKTSIEETSQMDKIFHGSGFVAGMMRKFMFNTVWSFNMKNDKFNNNRPQLSFLPFVEDRGTSKAVKQKVSRRMSNAV